MNREIISDKQAISLVVLFIIGTTLILGIGAEAGKDSWIVVLLGILISLPMVMIYARILSLFPNMDFFEILQHIFGKFIGGIISLSYIWFALHLGSLVLRNLGEYIVTVSLIETPIIIPMVFFIFLCSYVIKSGIEVLGRWGEFALIILLFFILLTVVFLIPDMELNNIRPILNKGVQPIIMGAFSVFAFPFAETVLFCTILSFASESKSIYKIYFWGIVIGGAVVFIAVLRNILVLGETSYITSYFPSHKAVSRTNIGNFIQRLEIIISVVLMGAGLVKISICLIGACRGITKILGFKDYRFIVIPTALLMLNLSYLIYDSAMEMFQWAFEIWPYYAFLFQVILPILILMGGEIRVRRSTQRGNSR